MATILVGPWCAGKSTWATILAEETGRDFVDLDSVAESYGAEIGWSVSHLIERNAAVGMVESEAEWEHVRVHALSRVVADHPQSVIALGASYTSYTDPDHKAAAKAILDDHEVILVTPSLDDDRAAVRCWQRALKSRGHTWSFARMDLPSWTPTDLDRQCAVATAVTSPGSRRPEIVAVADSRYHLNAGNTHVWKPV